MWRTWNFIPVSYSDERWLYYQYCYYIIWCILYLLNLRVKELKMLPNDSCLLSLGHGQVFLDITFFLNCMFWRVHMYNSCDRICSSKRWKIYWFRHQTSSQLQHLVKLNHEYSGKADQFDYLSLLHYIDSYISCTNSLAWMASSPWEGGGGGGIHILFWLGVCHLVLKTLVLFHTKNIIIIWFSIPYFRPHSWNVYAMYFRPWGTL